MTNHRQLSCAALLLWSLCAQSLTSFAKTSDEFTTSALQARITRVEQGLSTSVVVKDSPDQKMTLTDRMAFYQVPAVSIALINKGKIEWARAYGMTDVASRRRATPTTVFEAASISKSVSAIGAMRLVEQGKLPLDEDVNRRLVSWKIPQNEFTREKPVTLRMLLNHSAGTTVHGFHGYARYQTLPSLLQVLDGVAPANSEPVRIDITPGSAWRYSGGGYAIVQLMMSEASAKPFDQYMKAAVLDPLGMVHSTFVTPLPGTWNDRAATAYYIDGKSVAGQWHNYPESAAAGLWTTPSDLARVVIEIQRAESGQSSKVLSRNTAKTMLTRGLGEYGLGFFVEDLGDRTSFSHSGGSEGFRTRLYGYTRTGQGVVVLTNSDNGAALIEEVLRSVAAEYGWPEFHVTKKTALAGDAEVNRHLAGEYQLENLPAHIVAEGERLYFQSQTFGPRRLELFPESKTAFFMTAQDMTMRFDRNDEGAIVGFNLVRGTETYTAKWMKSKDASS